MSALHVRAIRLSRAAAASAALCLAAGLTCAQPGRPHDGAAAAASTSDRESDARFQEAMLAYERNHWSLAFVLLAALADDGHAEAARIALQMQRHGPTLYRSEFGASAERIERWTLVTGCAVDTSGAACPRALQARRTR